MSSVSTLPSEPSVETPNSSMKLKRSTVGMDLLERRSLQTLQYSPESQHLVGTGVLKQAKASALKGKKAGKSMITPSDEPLIIYADEEDENREKKVARWESKGSQTDDSLLEDVIQERLKRQRTSEPVEALDDSGLVLGDSIPDRYWELLAEERRAALEEALEENKNLHQEVKSLKEENARLLDVVEKAQMLSQMLESVWSDEEEGCDDVQ